MKKKLFYVLLLLVVILVGGCSAKEKSAVNQESSANLQMTVNVGENEGEIKYLVEGLLDDEYEKHGVESFAVSSEGVVYLLNGASNSIKVYDDGKFVEEIVYGEENVPMDIEISDNGEKLYILLDTGEYLEYDTILKRGENSWNSVAYDADEETLVIGFIKKDGNILIKEAGEENSANDKRGFVSRDDYSNLDSSIQGMKSVIGYDKDGNKYILSTILLYNNVGNMDIDQAIYKINSKGEIKGVTKVYDNIDYITPNKNIYISSNGKIYQLCTYENKVEIMELELGDTIAFESSKKQSVLNKIEKNMPAVVESEDIKRATTGTKYTRDQMYTRALAITNVAWTFNSTKNKVQSSSVTLPKQFRGISGNKAATGLPYCWGGWDSKDGFLTNINNSKTAGNVNCTGGFKGGTAGTDCSGFVSRVWGMSSKLGTSMIIDNGWMTKISYDKLKKMDILVRRGHVMFYVSGDSGGITSLESTTGGTEQKAKKYYRTWTYLRNDGYIAGKYKNTVETTTTTTVASKIDYTVPSNIKLNTATTFKGTFSGSVATVKRQVTGSTLVNVGKVSGGTFSFDVTFVDKSGSREMTVFGYDSSGKQVAKVVKTFNVGTVASTINFTAPTTVRISTTAKFSGTFAGEVVTVKRQITGSTLYDLGKVSGGKFSFDVTFGDNIGTREMTVWGYNSAGKEVAKVAKKFDVTKKGTVTAGTLNVRSGAGTNFGILGTLTKDKTVEIVSTASGWHKIKYGSGYGYVSTSYIK